MISILAFCGFYVAAGNQPLFNDATQVVLMRAGTRTVLSMQNTYEGPPEAFAMVVPVPAVLHEADVKTLPRDVFAHVERMSAPRLVEYWEQDPCEPPLRKPGGGASLTGATDAGLEPPASSGAGVTVEARFAVGEYQIVILSAKEATALQAWLRDNHYNIPANAEPLLRPYVEAGSKFFVAKVDAAKITFEAGRAALSPLRFYYDADELTLPIRLGLANSNGTQDLIVNILAPDQRYEVANYPNVTIPTNLDVKEAIKDRFAAFYTALFDRTLETHPGAVVTEYAWAADTCDPCPGPVLDDRDFQTLGADVLGPKAEPQRRGFVLTRLHARYGNTIANDLVFRQADPIVGGRELAVAGGMLEHGARSDQVNNFQGRYAIRHPWTGPIRCEHPQRDVWGGPPEGTPTPDVKAALALASAPRASVQLRAALAHDVPEIDLRLGASISEPRTETPAAGSAMASTTKKRTGCGCQTTERNELLAPALLFGASLLLRRRGHKRS